MHDTKIREALEKHHTASYGWALHCCDGNPNEAEEVLQVAYLEVLDGKARFAGRSRFRTWLFSVIRNTAAGRRRKRRLRAALLMQRGDEVPRSSPAPRADQVAESKKEQQRLRAALDTLPRRQRELLLLTFYHDMTIAAAGDALGISLGSARTHYHRGKEKLRAVLGGNRGT
jgi:RNA polymerase sigma-70 factor (ECF subfamily)